MTAALVDEPEKKILMIVASKGAQTPSEVPYAEVCSFSIARDEAALPATAKYKVYATCGADL